MLYEVITPDHCRPFWFGDGNLVAGAAAPQLHGPFLRPLAVAALCMLCRLSLVVSSGPAAGGADPDL